jgi:hypothetical protein
MQVSCGTFNSGLRKPVFLWDKLLVFILIFTVLLSIYRLSKKMNSKFSIPLCVNYMFSFNMEKKWANYESDKKCRNRICITKGKAVNHECVIYFKLTMHEHRAGLQDVYTFKIHQLIISSAGGGGVIFNSFTFRPNCQRWKYALSANNFCRTRICS